MRDFTDNLKVWFDNAVSRPLPPNIAAFCVNVFMHWDDNSRFGVELIGAARFDISDSDWPCDEIWSPKPRSINFPINWSGEDWQECLIRTQVFLENRLSTNCAFSQIVKSTQGLGVGFVDGDLKILWQHHTHS